MAIPYRHVLLIGATSGIGKGLADRLIKGGVKVTAIGRRKDKLDVGNIRSLICYLRPHSRFLSCTPFTPDIPHTWPMTLFTLEKFLVRTLLIPRDPVFC